MRLLSTSEAIREALTEEMARDERILILGEDVGVAGGVFRATEGFEDVLIKGEKVCAINRKFVARPER